MSALTSSPSPAASPRSSTHSHMFVAPTRRPSKSPLYPSTSPPTTRPPVTSAKPLDPSQHQENKSTAIRPQYSDAGTQYSPEGYPPTAQQKTTSEGFLANHKRKDISTPPSMNSAVEAPGSPNAPPQEPELRERPEATTAANPTQVLPSRSATKSEDDTSESGSSTAAKRARNGSGALKIMPAQYETCNPKDLGVLIANMLMELIRLNDTIPLRDGQLTRFHSRAPPGISCHDYLLRLIQHATLSPPILLSMVYYIDRLCALYPAFTISSLTVHRFLITSATVASKGLSDSFWTNPIYARIGGISTSELATLEMEFLQRVDWRIVPKPETLVDYYVSLVQRSEGYVLEDTSNGEDRMQEDPT